MLDVVSVRAANQYQIGPASLDGLRVRRLASNPNGDKRTADMDSAELSVSPAGDRFRLQWPHPGRRTNANCPSLSERGSPRAGAQRSRGALYCSARSRWGHAHRLVVAPSGAPAMTRTWVVRAAPS